MIKSNTKFIVWTLLGLSTLPYYYWSIFWYSVTLKSKYKSYQDIFNCLPEIAIHRRNSNIIIVMYFNSEYNKKYMRKSFFSWHRSISWFLSTATYGLILFHFNTMLTSGIYLTTFCFSFLEFESKTKFLNLHCISANHVIDDNCNSTFSTLFT